MCSALSSPRLPAQDPVLLPLPQDFTKAGPATCPVVLHLLVEKADHVSTFFGEQDSLKGLKDPSRGLLDPTLRSTLLYCCEMKPTWVNPAPSYLGLLAGTTDIPCLTSWKTVCVPQGLWHKSFDPHGVSPWINDGPVGGDQRLLGVC